MLNNRKLILFLLFSIWPFFAAASDADNAARLIAVIEKGDPNFLYDMHGNSNRELRALQLSRFRATPDVTGFVKARIHGGVRQERSPKCKGPRRILAFLRAY